MERDCSVVSTARASLYTIPFTYVHCLPFPLPSALIQLGALLLCCSSLVVSPSCLRNIYAALEVDLALSESSHLDAKSQ